MERNLEKFPGMTNEKSKIQDYSRRRADIWFIGKRGEDTVYPWSISLTNITKDTQKYRRISSLTWSKWLFKLTILKTSLISGVGDERAVKWI